MNFAKHAILFLDTMIIKYFKFLFQALMVLKGNNPKTDYKAAVVEYSPIIFDSPRKTILENVDQYETIINNASHYVSTFILMIALIAISTLDVISFRTKVEQVQGYGRYRW